MRRQTRMGLAWTLWCLWGLAQAAVSLPGAVVDGAWLKAHVDAPELVILDVQEQAQYRQHHVPGAVNIPFTRWRSGADEQPPLSLPPLKRLASLLGSEGIDRETPVIIMNTGAGPGDVAAVARVYWSLVVLGHEHMAILDGGLVDYVNRHHGAYVRGAPPNREPAMYRPRPNKQVLVTRDQLARGVTNPLLDARSLPEHVGLVAGPGDRPGTLPGARHLPFDWLVDDKGLLRDKAALDKLFAYAGIPQGGAVHFCHTGNRAALTWFADYALLGHRDARLYDGSMMEWSRDPSLPLERKLDL
ncbi:sulfurtransferase [endosymbiont of unidentified scaly snail isolate Monju]|uniref:sulfurtransferase n=1 Tax=endosymbiont of unidentified scaly snail isolate Monju TaxID=1248727 RepID=UPI0009DF5467|nr:rhodanese-like domain-containing protein [endosymbiont of unidentified scaly snail isolate Monju]